MPSTPRRTAAVPSSTGTRAPADSAGKETALPLSRTAERKQCFVRTRRLQVALQEELRGQKRGGHAIAAVPECKEVSRISPMHANIRKPIRCFGEQAFPREGRLGAG